MAIKELFTVKVLENNGNGLEWVYERSFTTLREAKRHASNVMIPDGIPRREAVSIVHPPKTVADVHSFGGLIDWNTVHNWTRSDR